MTDNAASRFYGMDVTDEVVGQVTENLTDWDTDDLVAAHLGRNWTYFGAIDKTLAGFVILDDEGDNYTLLDARDAGQIWWQDHETREAYLQLDSLADYIACNEAIAEACDEADDEDDVDADEIREGFTPTPRVGTRAVSSLELLDRYQWLVWFLAQPMMQNGKPTQSIEELCSSGLGHFSHYWKSDERVEEAFEAELSAIGDDAHLAIYWLLHALCRDEPARGHRVLDVLDASSSALVQSFMKAVGTFDAASSLEVVPNFAARRSVMAMVRGFGLYEADPASAFRSLLRSLAIDAEFWSLRKAMPVAEAIEAGTLSVEDAATALETLAGDSIGVTLLRACVDKRRPSRTSSHADALAAMITDERVEWRQAMACLWLTYEIVGDVDSLGAACLRLLNADSYHRRIVKMAQAAEKRGAPGLGSASQLNEQLEIAEAIMPAIDAAFDAPESFSEVREALPEPHQLKLAQRLLVWAEHVDAAAVQWAALAVATSELDDRLELVRQGFSNLAPSAQHDLLVELAKPIDAPEHPLVELLFTVLETPDPDDSDYAASFAAKDMKEEVVQALAPFASEPEVFDRIVAFLETGTSRHAREGFVQKLFNPFEEESFVLDNIGDEQAVGAARAMLAMMQDDDVHVRNTAGHQLYRFRHPGAEDFVRESLDSFGRKYAEHGDDGPFEKIVANLYASLRAMGTPTSKEALVERLFKERRSYWRLGNAIGEVFGDDVHALTLAKLSERRDADAAAAYCASLVEFVKKNAPIVDLAEAVSVWGMPNDEDGRARLKYVLLVGTKVALEAKNHEVVKAAWSAAGKIEETAYAPYYSVDRGRDFVDPFADDEALRASLEQVVSGRADEKLDKARKAAAAARRKGKPKARVSDGDLGLLGGCTVSERVFENRGTKELWFRDTDGQLHFFDGYDVEEPPFTFEATFGTGMGAFLQGAPGVSDRAMFWTDNGSNFEEWVRWGDRIAIYRGANNGGFTSFGVRCHSTDAADALMATIRANPPRKMSETSPWYVPGCGAVVRKTYQPKPDGGWNSDGTQYEAVFRGGLSWRNEDYGSDAAAADAFHRYEAEILRDGNGAVSTIEWMERMRRDEDFSLEEWMRNRQRSDTQNAAWHVHALADISRQLLEQGVRGWIDGFEVHVAPAATDAAISTLAIANVEPLPEVLAGLWHEVGGAFWKVGARSERLLGPQEMLSRRDKTRALGQDFIENRMSTAEQAQNTERFARLDTLVEDQNGEPVTFMTDHPINDGRVFASAQSKPSDFWWEKALGWNLATRFVSGFVDSVLQAEPLLRMLWFGQAWHAEIARRRFELDGKFWEILVDEEFGMYATRSGKIGTAGRVTLKRIASPAKLRKAAEKAIAAKVRKGYAEQ